MPAAPARSNRRTVRIVLSGLPKPVAVHDEGHRDHISNGRDCLRYFGDGGKTDARDAQTHICDAGPGYVDDLVPEILDHTREQRVRCAGHRDGFALADEAFEFCCRRHEASPRVSWRSPRCALPHTRCPRAFRLSCCSSLDRLFLCDRWNREHWVQDRRFLAMRMVYLLKTERDAACEAKATTLSVITPASPR